MAEQLTKSLKVLAERGAARGASQVLRAARLDQTQGEVVVTNIGDLEPVKDERARRRRLGYTAVVAAAAILVIVALIGIIDRSANVIIDQPAPTADTSPSPSTPDDANSSLPGQSEPSATTAPDGFVSGVRVVDDRQRNPASWFDDYGLPPDSFVPQWAGYGADGFPMMLYWVGLPSPLFFEPLPDEIKTAIGWGSLRIARCTDQDCSGEIELSPEVVETRYLGGSDQTDVDVMADGSLIITFGEIGRGPGGEQMWVLCEDSQCANPVVRTIVEVAGDPLTPGGSRTLQVAVSGADVPVIAYLTGPVETELLRVAVCRDTACSSFAGVVDIDRAVMGFELFIDAQGHPAVLYRRWGEDSQWLATCSGPQCSGETNRVAITDRAGPVSPLVRENADLAFWFTPQDPGPTAESQSEFLDLPVELIVIECLDSRCDQTRELPGFEQFAAIPTNLEFADDAFCGERWANGPDGSPTVLWCDSDQANWMHTLARCDDFVCSSAALIQIPSRADGLFMQILHNRSADPILVMGNVDSGLGLRIVHVERLDK